MQDITASMRYKVAAKPFQPYPTRVFPCFEEFTKKPKSTGLLLPRVF
jgi:hypothetical protein